IHPAVAALRTSSPCTITIAERQHGIPECRRSEDDVSPDGSVIVLAEPDQKQHDAYVFRLMSSTGDSIWSRTLRLHTAPFTEEHRQSWLERMSAYPGAAERISLPIWLSPVRYIRVGDDGTIWVRGILQDDQRAWSLISDA